ncbi:hypothetical protein [Mariniflexile sp.]|uniref:hypothetical protein n=1 Tax=Mariniflexile sp. TaxID=1979402 RepID=UPI00356142D1
MKRLFIIALALVTIQGIAQERKERPNRENRTQRMSDLTPEEMATLQTKKMTLHLDLNESQQKQIHKLNLENATAKKEMMETFKAKKESNSKEKPSKEERLKMMNAKLDHQIATKARMKSILSKEQFEKWETDQEKMRKHAMSQRNNNERRKGDNQKN